MSRRPRSVAADIDLIAYPDKYISGNTLYSSGALQASMERYLILKEGATSRLKPAASDRAPGTGAWYHRRMRRGWK